MFTGVQVLTETAVSALEAEYISYLGLIFFFL